MVTVQSPNRLGKPHRRLTRTAGIQRVWPNEGGGGGTRHGSLLGDRAVPHSAQASSEKSRLYTRRSFTPIARAHVLTLLPLIEGDHISKKWSHKEGV